jgi:DNA-directed RNA polymerase specialized sigma54-like protein
MKNFKLTEEQFVLLTANSLTLKNNYIREMNKAEHQELKDFYQKEIDRINELFDSLNFKFKTDF